MSAVDTVKIQPIYTEVVSGQTQTNLGMEERKTLQEFVNLLPAAGAAVAGSRVLITRQTAPAVPAFADVAAAQAWCILLRNALIAAGVLV